MLGVFMQTFFKLRTMGVKAVESYMQSEKYKTVKKSHQQTPGHLQKSHVLCYKKTWAKIVPDGGLF